MHCVTAQFFPPILLMVPDVLIDGNTRLKAVERVGRQTFPTG
jgi:hypothetical protein